MKISTKKSIILVLFCCVFCVSCLLFVMNNKANAENGVINKVEIKQLYWVGEELNLSNASVKYDNVDYNVSQSLLYLPSGDILSGKVFNLQLKGNYVLELKANTDSGVVIAKEEFSVVDNAYLIDNTSSYTYKSNGVTTANDGRTGLEVSLSEGAEFIFNQPIDITNCNLGQTPVISFCPFQYSGAYDNDLTDSIRTVDVDATKFYVKLTDCYDSTKYVIVELLNRNVAGGMAENPWYSAGANGQILGALDPSVFRNQGYNGEVVPYNGTEWFSLYEGFGVSVGGALPLNTGSISIHYDTKTNKVYANQLANTNIVEKSIFINDLSDAHVQDNPFEGFTTGEVYLSVYASGYKGVSASFDVTEICGISGEQLNKTYAEDVVAPKIIFNEQVKDSYFAARGSKVTIKKATSYDVNNARNALTTTVYYAYGTSNQTIINVDNGEFNLNKLGSYTIEYKAVDTYGNETIKTIEIISIDCTSSNGKIIQVDVPYLSSTQEGGATVELPSFDIYSPNGDVKVSATITMPNGQEICFEDGKGEFCFTQLGQVGVSYVLFDGIVEEIIDYKINVVSSNNVLFNDLSLPIGFIKDATYSLEKMVATVFDGQTESSVVADAFVIEDGKETQMKAISYDSFTVCANESVQFVYKVGSNEKRSDVIKVYDVNYSNSAKLDKSKYFISNMEVESQRKYINLKSKLTAGTDSFEFINYVSISCFEFKFFIPAEQADFSRLEITLYDIENAEKNNVTIYYKQCLITAQN